MRNHSSEKPLVEKHGHSTLHSMYIFQFWFRKLTQLITFIFCKKKKLLRKEKIQFLEKCLTVFPLRYCVLTGTVDCDYHHYYNTIIVVTSTYLEKDNHAR